MNNNPIYIFFHNPKCGGTTFRFHIENNLNKNEIISAYYHRRFFNVKTKKIEYYAKNPSIFKEAKVGFIKYLESLTEEEKNKIKIIYGHDAFYGIHKFFPNRKPKYIMFVRNPSRRIVSCYNFSIDRLKYFKQNKIGPDEIFQKEIKLKLLKKILLKNRAILPFKEWAMNRYNSINGLPAKSMLKALRQKLYINTEKPNKEEIKECLNKFYFIGITENYEEDSLFLYHLLGIKKFYENKNASKKHFILTKEEEEEIKKIILEKNLFDQKLYDLAVEKNKKFKRERTTFKEIIKEMKLKKISYYSDQKEHKIMQFLYKISAILKKHSKIYLFFINEMKLLINK